MSTSMVSTVLEIEREAEAILAKAAQDAEKTISDAKTQRDTASREATANAKKEIENLEAAAKADRASKIEALQASGETALKAVTNISESAFGKGVDHLFSALARR